MKNSLNLIICALLTTISVCYGQQTNSDSCDPAPLNIVAWWPGEGNANDHFNNNNGILQGSISFAPGEVGEAFLYTTTNDDVFIPASPSLNVAAQGSFTVEAWINPTDLSQGHCIFEWNNGSAEGVQFYVFNDPAPASLYANIVDSSGNWHIMESSVAPLETNVFQHVALTYDQASGTATMYCNGVIVGQQNLGSFTPQTSYDLYLGRRPLGFDSTWTFSGLIDEPSIYNRALSSNEIAAIYNTGSEGKCDSCDPAPSCIVSWWPGESNADDIISANNGILQGPIGFGPGEVGEGFLYTTTNDDVFIPASPSLNVAAGGSFTLESWINPTDVSQGHCIFEWNSGSAEGVQFYVFNDPAPASLYANIVDSSGNWHIMESSVAPLKTNTFQHVALTYDEPSGTATMYCNGVIVGQQNLGSFTPQTSYGLYLGRRPLGFDSTWTFSGIIDEPSIYNCALSSNEIQVIYNAGRDGKCLPMPICPVIVTQPTNETVMVGGTASFSVVAVGSAPLSYQWSFDGTPLAGATSATLTLTDVQLNQAGTYAVEVTNLYCSTNSIDAVLSITTTNTTTNTYVAFGTTYYGGTNNYINGLQAPQNEQGDGTVFALTSGGDEVVLHYFTGNLGGGINIIDGNQPMGDLICSNGALYGTTEYGGKFGDSSHCGTVFKMNTDGSNYRVLYSFSNLPDGQLPEADLVLAGNKLYGTTLAGGTYNEGTVFRINTDGSDYTNLYSFEYGSEENPYDGAGPQAALILVGNTLYGTTEAGGPYNYGYTGFGTVFRINTDGSGYANLYDFTGPSDASGLPVSDGANPIGGLCLVGTTLYGTTEYGGNSGYGTVFSITTSGTYQPVYSFSGAPNDGALPMGGLILLSNRLYGTTMAGGGSAPENPSYDGTGTVFGMNLDGSEESVILSFPMGPDGQPNGYGPNSEGYPGMGPIYNNYLAVGQNSELYGATESGGLNGWGEGLGRGMGYGMIFTVNTNGTGFVDLHDFGDPNVENNQDGNEPFGGICIP